jgi:hypothetical protein
MKGYVMNKSNIWMHAMKRSVRPGERIELAELYEQYGVKHDLSEGEEFVQWLRNVKLKDTNKWSIVLQAEEDGASEEAEKVEEKGAKDTKIEKKSTPKAAHVAPPVPDKMGVADVVGLSVRQGREILPKDMDLKLLKYSYEEARQLAGKDSLCREIKKRIRALEISR